MPTDIEIARSVTPLPITEVAKNAGVPGTALPVLARDVQEKPLESTAPDTGYWISSKSHIRHNPKCRNYRKVKGHPCGPNDGKPCRACGG